MANTNAKTPRFHRRVNEPLVSNVTFEVSSKSIEAQLSKIVTLVCA